MSISVVVILAGILILGISFYQYHQIQEGRVQENRREKKLESSDNLRTIGFILLVVGIISFFF